MVTIRDQPDLEAKVRFLRRPEAFPDAPRTIEVIETHFAWVFLSRELVYKLKKPIKLEQIDFTTLAARRANCELEVALNRRLARNVYLGVVPLTLDGSHLALEGSAEPIEWLVKMRRLPRDRMLDRAAELGTVHRAELEAVMSKLAAFYRGAVRAPWDARAYARVLLQRVAQSESALLAPELRIDSELVRRVADKARSFIASSDALLARRVAEERVVDAHGDLRPEHVCLTPAPQIIDCLEFSAELRLLDTADEIAFLTLECLRMGHEALAVTIAALYREHCADPVEPALYEFYGVLRALVRAMLAAWHLREPLAAEALDKWRQRARWYLETAAGDDLRAHFRSLEGRVRTAGPRR